MQIDVEKKQLSKAIQGNTKKCIFKLDNLVNCHFWHVGNPFLPFFSLYKLNLIFTKIERVK